MQWYNTFVPSNGINLYDNSKVLSLVKIQSSLNASQDINNNFKYLEALLRDNRKQIAFLDMLKIIDFIDEKNVGLLEAKYFDLSPGQCLGIELDNLIFRDEVYGRGDYILKKQNGLPQRVKGPATIAYLPVLNNSSLTLSAQTSNNKSADYGKLEITYNESGNPSYKLYDKQGENPIEDNITFDKGILKHNDEEVHLLDEYDYKLQTQTQSGSIIKEQYILNEEHKFVEILKRYENAHIIVKAYMGLESGNLVEVYNAITVEFNSSSNKYKISKVDGMKKDIIVEVI